MYYDIKKELDVARIESLMKLVSPAASHTSSDAEALSSDIKASNATSKVHEVNQNELRRMLDSM